MGGKFKAIVAFGALILVGLITSVIFVRVLMSLADEDVIVAKTEPQVLETEKGEEVTISRIGTSSIKKLDLENGSIYFTDGWGVYVPNK